MTARLACRIIAAIVVACFALVATLTAATAEIVTSKKHYAVGEGMVVYGAGFSRLVTITLTVERPDHLTDVVAGITTDTTGAFTATYTPPEIPGRYKFTATDGTNSATTATTGADAIGYNKAVYNKKSFDDVDLNGTWTSGNAGSFYRENQWAFYQYQVTGIGDTIPSFDVVFNHFQSSTGAVFVDGFANFRACLDCTVSSNTSGSSQGMLLDGIPQPPSDPANWIDAHDAISNINRPFLSGVCSATKDPVAGVPSDDHCFHVDGDTLMNLLGAGNFASGTHTVTLYYQAHLAATFVWSQGKEYLLGCPSDPSYVAPLTGAVPGNTVFGTDAYSGGALCGAADAGDWTALYRGIGYASGSSRHFEIDNQSSGSQGGLALPIPGVTAPTGSITIIKVTQPGVAANLTFPFTATGVVLTSFTLATDSGTGFSNTKTFTGLTGGISYTVTESSEPSGWSLTLMGCVDNNGSSTFSYTSVPSSSGGTATINLASTANAAVTCTFTNTGAATLVIRKTSVGGAGTFEFTSTGGLPNPADGTGHFSITTTAPNTQAAMTFNGLAAGTAFTVSEVVPAHWSLSTRMCEETAAGSGGSTFPASGTSQPAQFMLAVGATITCTYSNTKNATLVIRKTTVGDVGTFNFASSGGLPSPANASGNFSLTTTSQNTPADVTFEDLAPGSVIGVTETAAAGWTLASRVCALTVTGAATSVFPASGTTQPASITVAAGDSVTCTYTNIRNPTTLRIVKLVHGTEETFHFAVSGTDAFPDIPLLVPANGSNSTVQMPISGGAHTVVEQTPPPGWTLTDISCTIGSPVDANNPLAGWNFTAGSGDTVVCTFVNSNVLTTRTQGFWATHTALANRVWGGNGTTPPPGAVVVAGTGDAKLCGPTELSAATNLGTNELMGGFWANIATKLKNNAKRSTLDQARMQMLQQYLAAVLNFHMWGSPVPGGGLGAARTAYCGTNVTAIKSWIGILGSYNTSGDSLDFTPGASATVAASKSQANLGFWDTTYQKP